MSQYCVFRFMDGPYEGAEQEMEDWQQRVLLQTPEGYGFYNRKSDTSDPVEFWWGGAPDADLARLFG